jgi:hypothetical protein
MQDNLSFTVVKGRKKCKFYNCFICVHDELGLINPVNRNILKDFSAIFFFLVDVPTIQQCITKWNTRHSYGEISGLRERNSSSQDKRIAIVQLFSTIQVPFVIYLRNNVFYLFFLLSENSNLVSILCVIYFPLLFSV